jgi:hypothetical protein
LTCGWVEVMLNKIPEILEGIAVTKPNLSGLPGISPHIGLRIPVSLREQLDRLAAQYGLERSAMVRQLIMAAVCPPDKKMARESGELSEPGAPIKGVNDDARVYSTADVR